MKNRAFQFLFIFTILLPVTIFGQANFMSIFEPVCLVCPSTPVNYKLNCTTSTPSFSLVLPNLNDPLSFGLGGGLSVGDYGDYFKNSAYDQNGNMLFSVNADGIYDNTGTQVYSFYQPISYTSPCSPSVVSNYTFAAATSEIVVVPVPSVCNNYYVIFWSYYSTDGTFGESANGPITGTSYAIPRAVQVVVNPYSTAVIGGPSNLTIVQDKILNMPTCDAGAPNDHGFVDNSYAFEMVADAPNTDGSRDIYTVDYDETATPAASLLRQWHIHADGTLPTSFSIISTPTLLTPAFPKAKILSIPSATGTGNDKVLSYIASNTEYSVANYLQTYDFATSNIVSYKAPTATTSDYQYISGFEYLSSSNMYCFAYSDQTTTPFSGGLGYATLSTSNTSFSAIPSTVAYNYSDMEMSAHHDLYLNKWDGTNYNLYYIPSSSLSSFPSVIPTQCLLSGSAIPNFNFIPLGSLNYGNNLQISSPYLGTQIRGENYGNWGTMLQITGIDVNTICLPGNGSVNPTFTATVSGGVSPYNYLWSASGSGAPPVATFLSGSSVSSTSTSSTPLVDAVTADNNYVTFNLSVTDAKGCNVSQSFPVQFINSGWDLAVKDNPFDLYMEPFLASVASGSACWNIWESGDIRNNFMGSSNATYCGSCTDKNNTLSTKIRNVGCSDYVSATGSSVYLNTYWAIGGFGGDENWDESLTATDNDWTGAVFSGTTLPRGGHIGSIPLSSTIYAGTSQILSSEWIPPNPNDYSATLFPHPTNSMDLCYLARIVDGHNLAGGYSAPNGGATLPADPVFGMTYIETNGDVSPNVRNNNNIATLNSTDIFITAPVFHTQPKYIIAGNTSNIGKPISIQVINNFSLYHHSGFSTLSNFASFTVGLGSLFDIWQAAGGHGVYSSIDYNAKTVTFDGSNTLQLDSIVLDSGAAFIISVTPQFIQGTNLINFTPETFHFREIVDDTTSIVINNYTFNIKYQQPNPSGVLAVTEISKGNTTYPNCEYAEMLVTNCGTDASNFVDVSGWILDDNSDIFDNNLCSDGYGITQGHYRFAYNDIWQNVPVGSIIIAYNANVNCYNLPDTFTIDNTNNIYWIPVHSLRNTGESTYVLERYDGGENGSICSYCSDTGATVYTPAYGWMNTIALNPDHDAVQVRCPGCTPQNPRTPAFYQGIGYANAAASGFVTVKSGTNEAGGPVDYLKGKGASRFVFNGISATDFASSTAWQFFPPDTIWSAPVTLGNVNPMLYKKVMSHTLRMPCCNSSNSTTTGRYGNAENYGNNAGTGIQVTVYPNPAETVVNFQFSLSVDATIVISNMTGQIMQEATITNANLSTLNIKGYKPGIYFYQVTGKAINQTGKITIE